MGIGDKIYIAVSDWLIRILKENKRFLCAMFVVNLTYLIQIYSMGSVMEGYHGGDKILVYITIFFCSKYLWQRRFFHGFQKFSKKFLSG